tara:strand:+ start:10194 stop:10550 length:357 start_codon:yes stop_codon:yes gene_type:complete
MEDNKLRSKYVGCKLDESQADSLRTEVFEIQEAANRLLRRTSAMRTTISYDEVNEDLKLVADIDQACNVLRRELCGYRELIYSKITDRVIANQKAARQVDPQPQHTNNSNAPKGEGTS